MCAKPSMIWVSTRRTPPRSASVFIRWRCPGRSSARACEHFAEGLEEILVVEEKRAVIENQFKEQLYNWREDVRPRVIGKFDENRNWILPSNGELTPAQIARVIAQRIARFHTSPKIAERLAFLEAKERQLRRHRRAV